MPLTLLILSRKYFGQIRVDNMAAHVTRSLAAMVLAINSLVPGKFEWHFRYWIFQIITVINGWGISCELALRWMLRDLTDDKLTSVQVMAWCRQATSHYLSQCWPRSLSPYGVTRPQWVKTPRSLSSTKKVLKSLCHRSVEKLFRLQI